ncbi:hypothetical protein BMS3Bbin04_01064 [bacterium BMS3Bbin04]|nr:hypothetical protein BMS3Bbin04_01064 [bacterium BMS3Bbin04]
MKVSSSQYTYPTDSSIVMLETIASCSRSQFTVGAQGSGLRARKTNTNAASGQHTDPVFSLAHSSQLTAHSSQLTAHSSQA